MSAGDRSSHGLTTVAAPGARASIGPVPFTVSTLARTVDWIVATAETTRRGRAVLFWNAYNVALADSDPAYADLGRQATAVCCDGVPVVWAGRRLHPRAGTWERVYGPDAMAGVLDRGRAVGLRHYLLGSTPETLEALRRAIERRWPGAEVAGAESPPFRPATETELAERDARIGDSGAHLVWVGLGTPRQDAEALRLVASLPVTALGVGAAFDFLAGVKKQAPPVLQRAGLEWAFRLATEPRRLTHRYLWGNPRFLGVVLRQSVSQRLVRDGARGRT